MDAGLLFFLCWTPPKSSFASLPGNQESPQESTEGAALGKEMWEEEEGVRRGRQGEGVGGRGASVSGDEVIVPFPPPLTCAGEVGADS